jgi:tRNA A-37 threonylcarbamoyl transferase component Bud32
MAKSASHAAPRYRSTPPYQSSHEGIHIAFFREVLGGVRRVMAEKYDLHRTSIRPIGSDASRLSIPVTITGFNGSGKKVRYFGKILGSKDLLSDRSMQFFKNLYLQLNAQDPIFGFTETAEDMARQQYESLKAIYDTGIPTAKPHGYHLVNGNIWLLVAEFLESHPVSSGKEVTLAQIDTLLGYLKRLHAKGIYHGDIKSDNIMLGDKIYILDSGVFRDDVDASKKQAYDLACLICSVLKCQPVEGTVQNARKYYTRQNLLDVVEYIDLIQQRQDFHFDDQEKDSLKGAVRGRRAAVLHLAVAGS